METLTLRLDSILVDPRRFSPRRQPVEEGFLAELAEAIEHGETLPPLKVARCADPGAPWCGVAGLHTAEGLARLRADQVAVPWANLLGAPQYILYDGLAVYWALRGAGVQAWAVEVAPEPVTGPAEVLALAWAANARHGRRLGEGDQLDVFCQLWLGRAPRASHETWRPERGALTGAQIGAAMGRSEGWVAKQKRWAQVEHACADPQRPGQRLLGPTRAYAVSRLPEAQWRPFVWNGDQPRLYLPLDAELRPRGDAGLGTVFDLGVRDVERLVELVLAQEPLAVEPPAPDRPASDDGQAALDLAEETTYYQGVLPLEWTGPREPVNQILDIAPRLDAEQAREVISHFRPFYISVTAAWQKLIERARRLGVEV